MSAKEWFSGRGVDEPPAPLRASLPSIAGIGLPRLAWLLWAALIVLAIAVVIAAASCATLVDCPTYQLERVETSIGTFYVLDEDNFAKLIAQHNGLVARNCRTPPLQGAI